MPERNMYGSVKGFEWDDATIVADGLMKAQKNAGGGFWRES